MAQAYQAYGSEESSIQLFRGGDVRSAGVPDDGGFQIEESATEREWKKKEKSRSKGKKKLMISTFFVFLFMIAEIVGGILANSLAIMTDAAHLLSDVSSFAISILAITFARRKKTRKMSFGSGRFEILGATISIIIVWALTAWLLYEAVDRAIIILNHGHMDIDGRLMTIIASLGILVNLVLLFILGGGHDHDDDDDGGGHGHSHDIIGLLKQAFGKGGHSHSHGGGGHDHSHGGGHDHSHGGGGHDHSHGGGGHDHSHGGHGDGGHGHGGSDSDHGHSHGGGHTGFLAGTSALFGPLAAAQVHEVGMEVNRLQEHACREHEKCDTDPGDDHDDSGPAGQEEINVRAALIHCLGDLVQSVGVLVAAILIWIWPWMKIADPICTFLFSILVIFTTVPVIRSAVTVLLENTPAGIDLERLKRSIEAIEGVQKENKKVSPPIESGVHDLHCWSISEGVAMLVVHVKATDDIKTSQDCYELVDRIRDMLYKKYKLFHCTVEIDNAYLKTRQQCFFEVSIEEKDDGQKGCCPCF